VVKHLLLCILLLLCTSAETQTRSPVLVVTGNVRQVNMLYSKVLVRVSRVRTKVILASSYVVFTDTLGTDTLRVCTITRRKDIYTYALETPATFLLDIKNHLLQYNDTLTHRKVSFPNVKIVPKF